MSYTNGYHYPSQPNYDSSQLSRDPSSSSSTSNHYSSHASSHPSHSSQSNLPSGPIQSGQTGPAGPTSNNARVQPLLCSGHTRPVVHLQFSNLLEDGTYMLISACKDGNPMLRSWLGDWIGTFIGHKGAVWSTKVSLDTSRAATGGADYNA